MRYLRHHIISIIENRSITKEKIQGIYLVTKINKSKTLFSSYLTITKKKKKNSLTHTWRKYMMLNEREKNNPYVIRHFRLPVDMTRTVRWWRDEWGDDGSVMWWRDGYTIATTWCRNEARANVDIVDIGKDSTCIVNNEDWTGNCNPDGQDKWMGCIWNR